MCGIIGFHFTESVPSYKLFVTAIKEATKRGTDGIGAIVIRPSTKEIIYEKKLLTCDTSDIIEISYGLADNTRIGDIVMIQTRNAPETEAATIDVNKHVQPIKVGNEGEEFIFVHNGGVSDHDVNRYKDKMKTEIDSEVIGLAYLDKNRNMKDALESLSGSWSIFGYDMLKNRIYVIQSWLAGAHGYLRGLGYMFHSYPESIQEVFAEWKDLKDPNDLRFIRAWEDFYFHELQGYIIYEMDVDSGLTTPREYKHHFIHPTWDDKRINEDEKVVLVLASGGIDSTTTALVLRKHFNLPVELLHFRYGQKSMEAETLAVKQIAKYLGLNYRIFDITGIYNTISNPEESSSMLINPDIEVTTAGDDIKTVAAWVPMRNGLFTTIASAYAEELILSNKTSYAYIAGGWPVISESGGGYPDNGEKYVYSFHDWIRYASIAGAQGRIKYLNPFEGLTKREELILMKWFGGEDLFALTVSCDNAIVKDGDVYQCSHNGQPACGSGLLSSWAAEMIGLENKRKYYKVGHEVDIKVPEWKRQGYKLEVTKEVVNDILQRVKI